MAPRSGRVRDLEPASPSAGARGPLPRRSLRTRSRSCSTPTARPRRSFRSRCLRPLPRGPVPADQRGLDALGGAADERQPTRDPSSPYLASSIDAQALLRLRRHRDRPLLRAAGAAGRRAAHRSDSTCPSTPATSCVAYLVADLARAHRRAPQARDPRAPRAADVVAPCLAQLGDRRDRRAVGPLSRRYFETRLAEEWARHRRYGVAAGRRAASTSTTSSGSTTPSDTPRETRRSGGSARSCGRRSARATWPAATAARSSPSSSPRPRRGRRSRSPTASGARSSASRSQSEGQVVPRHGLRRRRRHERAAPRIGAPAPLSGRQGALSRQGRGPQPRRGCGRSGGAAETARRTLAITRSAAALAIQADRQDARRRAPRRRRSASRSGSRSSRRPARAQRRVVRPARRARPGCRARAPARARARASADRSEAGAHARVPPPRAAPRPGRPSRAATPRAAGLAHRRERLGLRPREPQRDAERLGPRRRDDAPSRRLARTRAALPRPPSSGPACPRGRPRAARSRGPRRRRVTATIRASA